MTVRVEESASTVTEVGSGQLPEIEFRCRAIHVETGTVVTAKARSKRRARQAARRELARQIANAELPPALAGTVAGKANEASRVHRFRRARGW